jgi:hypothetical protein
LTTLLTVIQEKQIEGGHLLDILNIEASSTGNPVVKNVFQRLLFQCHKVFFHQLNSWIVHGQLIDICEEFFIHKVEKSNQEGEDL